MHCIEELSQSKTIVGMVWLNKIISKRTWGVPEGMKDHKKVSQPVHLKLLLAGRKTDSAEQSS